MGESAMYIKMIRGLAWAAAVSICTIASAVPSYNITPLQMPVGTTDVYATGVNNAGQIVGHIADADGISHAALWSNTGAFTALPEFNVDGTFSEAYRINNAGQIVGKA